MPARRSSDADGCVAGVLPILLQGFGNAWVRIATNALRAQAIVDVITPEMCAGHFDDYPAMPVAMLMDGIHRLAVEHATKVTHPHVRLVTCVVEATQLAFAGEPVEFSVEQLTEVAPVDRAHYCSDTEIIVGNPVAEVEVHTAPDGTILSSKITKPSGVKSWDDAVLRAIEKTEVLPRDLDGRVPSPMIIALKPVG